MKHLLLIPGFLLLFLITSGQKIHSPAEIFQIMEKSQVTYELNMLNEYIPSPDRTENLNYNNFYRQIDEDRISTYQYAIGAEANDFLTKAEDYYSRKEYSLARDMYLKVLEIDSSYYQVMTYIGQMYENESNIEKAMEWYQTAINHNYIDYMAHWFLADAYQILGNKEEAINEITIALILNRNNPRIKNSFNNIYKLNKLKTSDWVFNPQVRIDSTGDHACRINYGEDWIGYAMVKALWKYEPGYCESMGGGKGTLTMLEEREALAFLLSSANKKKLKKVPEFKALQLALDHNMIDEFILFEIMLPEIPFVAYQLPEDMIVDIKNYVHQVRGKGK